MNALDFKHHLEKLPGVTSAHNFGYLLFFYGEEQMTPFASIADSDNDYDAVSNLKREGVFRLNIGLSREGYQQLFPTTPKEIDYTQLNLFLPHPHYSAQNFICILNPSGSKLEQAMTFLQEAYELAKRRYEKKNPA